MLTGKKIVLGVSGGIAAYKMANVASMLSKLHADIHVVMTENATHFITPETFEVLTGNHCYTDTFDRCMELHVPHIALGTQALVAGGLAVVLFQPGGFCGFGLGGDAGFFRFPEGDKGGNFFVVK